MNVLFIMKDPLLKFWCINAQLISHLFWKCTLHLYAKIIVVREAFFFCYFKYLMKYFVVRQKSLSIVDQFDQKNLSIVIFCLQV